MEDPAVSPRADARGALAACVLCALLAGAAAGGTAAEPREPRRTAAAPQALRTAPGAAQAPQWAAAAPQAPRRVAAPDTAAQTSEQAWTRARALADRQRYDDAGAVIRRALGRAPDDTDLLWLEAGVEGWAGRHREAVALYERLVERHPEMARDLRKDLAAERLAAGDVTGALRDLDLRLEEAPEDLDARALRAEALSQADRLAEAIAEYDRLLAASPDDPDLARARARDLGWMGRHREAIAAYGALLERNPRDEEARLGLAQNENWAGNHRVAARLFEAMLADGRSDPEIFKGLAYARYWSGRPDLARPVLNVYRAREPDDLEGRELDAMLEREWSTGALAGYERSDDTDALRVMTTTLEYRFAPGERTMLSALWRRDDLKDPGGFLHAVRGGGRVDQLWSDAWSGRAAALYLDPGRGRDADAIGEAALIHRPLDRLRIELGVAKDLVLTRTSLARNLRVRQAAAAVEWRAGDRLTLRAGERLQLYSDANRQSRFSAGARQVVRSSRRLEAALTFDVDYLRSHRDLDDGYYDPAWYVEFGPGAEFAWKPRDGWTLGLVARTGWQHEKGSSSDPRYDLTATVELPLGHRLGLGLEGERSSSNLSTASGFEQKRWAAYLSTRF